MFPTISVILTYFNEPINYVREAIDSVIGQTHSPTELILVDDGATHPLAHSIDTYADKVRIIRQQNAGLSAARNTGIWSATGEWLAFIDADDYWPPKRLEVQLKSVQQALVIRGMVQQFISPELSEDEKSKIYCPPHPMRGMVAGAMLLHRSVFNTVGLFPYDRNSHDQLDWFSRFVDSKTDIYDIPDIVLHRRLHKINMSYDDNKISKYIHTLKKSLDRRRPSSQGH